jgi:crotonobetaine/carnitine-CoA ligase
MNRALTPAEVLARYPVHPATVPALLASRAATRASDPALVCAQRTWTYGELVRAVTQLASELAAAGAAPGTPVAWCAPATDLAPLVFLACARLGAVFAPLNPALTEDEHRWLVGHTRPAVILAFGALRERLIGLATEAGIAAQAPDLAPLAAPDATVAELLRALSTHAAVTLPDPASIDPLAPLAIVYTSGTTGFPKGVVHTHRNYVWAAEAFVERMHLQPEERLLTVLPFFHINALFYSLGGALACGGTLTVGAGFSASRFWALVAESGATQCNTLAAIGAILCKRPRSEFVPGHRLRKVYGGPISPEVYATFRSEFGVPHLVEGYGMSEIPGACNNPFDGRQQEGTIGLPARHPVHGAFVAMRIVDEEGRELGDDLEGELEVRTPIAFQEYLHDPAQTAAALHEGWFRTGDVARRAADGYYTFVARRKDIIRVRGENVAGAELDRVLALHPGVAEAATIGVAAELGDEEILAVLVADGPPPPCAELAAFCRARLAAIKVPRYWVFVPELPHTPTGRVAKHALKADPALRAQAEEIVRTESANRSAG